MVGTRRLQWAWPEMNSGYIYEDKYLARTARSCQQAGNNVLEFYCAKHASTGNPHQWEERIARGQILVNGTPASADQRLRHGDQLSYCRPPWSEAPSPYYVDVCYEDDHLVVLDKPSGLQVLPAAMQNQRTVLTLLQRCYHPGVATEPAADINQQQQQQQQQQGQAACQAHVSDAGAALQPILQPPAAMQQQGEAVEPGTANQPSDSPQPAPVVPVTHLVPVPVHRLGRGTSGLLLCAVSEEARRSLAAAMTHTTIMVVGQRSGPADEQDPNSSAGAAHDTQGDSSPQRAGTHQGMGVQGQPAAPVESNGESGWETNPQILQGNQGVPPWPALPVACSLMDADQVPNLPPNAVRKLYRTRVQGIVHADEGEVRVPIGLVEHAGVRGGLWAACAGPGAHAAKAKTSRSAWRVVHREEDTNTTLMNVEIFTGRPHQIRIHMAAMGHPLVGDPLYAPGGLPHATATTTGVDDDEQGLPGGAESAALDAPDSTVAADAPPTGSAMPGDCGYALHSWQLLLHHPVRAGKVLHLVAPLPPGLAAPGEAA